MIYLKLAFFTPFPHKEPFVKKGAISREIRPLAVIYQPPIFFKKTHKLERDANAGA